MFKKVVSIIFIGLVISIFFTSQTYAMGNMGGNNGNNGNNGNQNNNGNNGKNNGNKGKGKKNKSVSQNIRQNKNKEINQKREYRVREFCKKNKEICIKNRKEIKTDEEKMLIAIELIDTINKYRNNN